MFDFDLAGSLDAAHRQGRNSGGCVKIEEDLDRYRRVIDLSRPDGIIEIGTFSGKSALWFARVANVPVLSIDVSLAHVDPATADAAAWEKVTFHEGASTAPETIQAVMQWVLYNDVQRPMVTLDGDHSAATVAAELGIYPQLVVPGGWCVVEDGLVRWMPDQLAENGGPYTGSPLDAIELFLERSPGWEIDPGIQGLYPVTQFPQGWLCRRS